MQLIYHQNKVISMNPRLVPIITGLAALSLAAFFVLSFEGLWHWLVASPLIMFVAWPSLKIGFFSSKEEVYKLTGADKFIKNDTISKETKLDSIWDGITADQIVKIQESFLSVCLHESLEQYTSSNELPTQVLESISKVTNQIAESVKISPAFVPLVEHQYVDSDHILRVMHRDNWTEFMISRPSLAPQPESYLDYLNKTYFNSSRT
jgi:hypothetical protein